MATKTVPLAELLAQSPFSPNLQTPPDASTMSPADLGEGPATRAINAAKAATLKFATKPLLDYLGPMGNPLEPSDEMKQYAPGVARVQQQTGEAINNLIRGASTPLNIGLMAALPGVSGFAAKAIRAVFAAEGLTGAIKAAKARNIPEAMISGILGLAAGGAPEAMGAAGKALGESRLLNQEAGFVDLSKMQDWPGYTKRALGEERIAQRVSAATKRLAKPDVGAPANPRTPLVTKGGFTFVAGDNTPQDRLNFIQDMMTPDEINKAAAWYGDVRDQMGAHFGKDNVDPTILAWAITQAAQSPEAGLREMLKAERLSEGMPEETAPTPPYMKDFFDLTQIKKGIGQKLADFSDVAAGKKTRTLMNDDPRFGEPFPIDRHTARAGGVLDSTFKGTLRDIFGADQVDPLKLDVKEGREGEVTETKYEYQSRKGQELVKAANDAKFNGRPWTAGEIQAAEWVALRKMQGLAPQSAFEMFKNNYTTLPFELGWADGSPLSEVMPSLTALPYQTNRAITQDVMGKIVEDLAPRFNVRVVKSETVPGGFESHVNPAVRNTVLASDGAVKDFVNAVSYAANQTTGLAYKVLPTGKGNTSGFDVVSPSFKSRATVAKYAQALSQAEPRLGGFTVEDVKGEPAIRFLNADERGQSNGLWSTKDFQEFDDAAEKVSTDLGIQTRTGWLSADIPAQSFNDWSTNPHGEQHLRRFLETDRLKDIEYLEGPFRAKVANWIEKAFRKHAPDAWRNRPSAGAKPQTIIPEDIPGEEDLPNPFEQKAASVAPIRATSKQYPLKLSKLGPVISPDEFTQGWILPDGKIRETADHLQSMTDALGGVIPRDLIEEHFAAAAGEHELIRSFVHTSKSGKTVFNELFSEPTDAQLRTLRTIEKNYEADPLFSGDFIFSITSPETGKQIGYGAGVKNIRRAFSEAQKNPFEEEE